MSKVLAGSGDATCSSGCSQEHPNLEKKILYIIIKFFYICSVLGTPSKFFFLNYLFYFQAKKKKPKKKIELKSGKKKNCNRAKPMASPTNYRGSKPMDSPKKKKKKNPIQSKSLKALSKKKKNQPKANLKIATPQSLRATPLESQANK